MHGLDKRHVRGGSLELHSGGHGSVGEALLPTTAEYVVYVEVRHDISGGIEFSAGARRN